MREASTTQRNGASPSPSQTSRGHTVEGFFHRPDDVARAVERLAAESVPADEVDVYVVDDTGATTRRISVQDEPGTLKGAIAGAAGGALVGLVIVILAVLDVFGEVAVDPLGATSLLGAIRTMVASAAMGVPIGAILGMGHWQGKKRMVASDFSGGAVKVVVETDELTDVARRVLREAGADQVIG